MQEGNSKGLDIHIANPQIHKPWAWKELGIPSIQEDNVWETVSLYRHLFERGATLEEIVERERIEIRREELPDDVPSMQLWVKDHSVFVIDARLKDTDYRRAMFHELFHHFKPRKASIDPAHPHSHDYLARVFAELCLQFYGHSIPPMGRLELTLQEIDKTMEFV